MDTKLWLPFLCLVQLKMLCGGESQHGKADLIFPEFVNRQIDRPEPGPKLCPCNDENMLPICDIVNTQTDKFTAYLRNISAQADPSANEVLLLALQNYISSILGKRLAAPSSTLSIPELHKLIQKVIYLFEFCGINVPIFPLFKPIAAAAPTTLPTAVPSTMVQTITNPYCELTNAQISVMYDLLRTIAEHAGILSKEEIYDRLVDFMATVLGKNVTKSPDVDVRSQVIESIIAEMLSHFESCGVTNIPRVKFGN